METFDASRLDAARYNLGKSLSCLELQQTFEDFFELVRTAQKFDQTCMDLCKAFITLLNNDKSFELAARVVPELREDQSFDTSTNTLVNKLLENGSVKARRPQPPLSDPENNMEREMLRDRIRNVVYYMELEQKDRRRVIQGRLDEAEALANRAADAMFESAKTIDPTAGDDNDADAPAASQ